MESPNPNPSDLSNKNNEETVEPRVQGESSAEEEAANDNNPDNQQHEAAVPQPLVDQDREYGCKYCHKRFSNKQALGGHQNAHKVERAMEKNARDHAQEHHQNHFNYFPGAENSVYPGMQIMNPNPPPPPQTHHFLDSHNYHRSNNSLLNWPYINSHSQQQSLMQQHHHQVGAHIGYHNVGPSPPPPPRPIVAPLPLTMTYVNPPPRPLSGFNNAAYNSYPRINNNVINNNNNNNHNYPHLSSFMQQNQGFSNQVLNNLRINNPGVVGAGSSSSGIGAGPSAAPGPSTFAGPRIGPEWNPNNPARGEDNINLQMSLPGGVDEQAEDPDMDLSLKL